MAELLSLKQIRDEIKELISDVRCCCLQQVQELEQQVQDLERQNRTLCKEAELLSKYVSYLRRSIQLLGGDEPDLEIWSRQHLEMLKFYEEQGEAHSKPE